MLKQIKKLFTEHPATVNETYLQHMAIALGFSIQLLVAACCAFIHSFFPFLFQKTSSTIVRRISKKCHTRENRNNNNNG